MSGQLWCVVQLAILQRQGTFEQFPGEELHLRGSIQLPNILGPIKLPICPSVLHVAFHRNIISRFKRVFSRLVLNQISLSAIPVKLGFKFRICSSYAGRTSWIFRRSHCVPSCISRSATQKSVLYSVGGPTGCSCLFKLSQGSCKILIDFSIPHCPAYILQQKITAYQDAAPAVRHVRRLRG